MRNLTVIDDEIDGLVSSATLMNSATLDVFGAPAIAAAVRRLGQFKASAQYLIALKIDRATQNPGVPSDQSAIAAERRIYEGLRVAFVNEVHPQAVRHAHSGGSSLTREPSVWPGQVTESLHKVFDVLWRALRKTCFDVADEIMKVPVPDVRPEQIQRATLAHCILDSLDHYLAAASKSPADDRTRRWSKTYRADFIRDSSLIPLPDLGTRRQEQYTDLFVDPCFSGELFERSMTLGELEEMVDRTVILGDPGSGKSTVSRILGVKWAEKDRPVFLITARSLQVENAGIHLVEEIEHMLLRDYVTRAPEGFVERTLLEGSVLLVLDGLDEVDSLANRKRVTRVVEAVSHRYPLCRILVTARSIGYAAVRLEPTEFAEYKVNHFSAAQVEEYATNWFRLDRRMRPPDVTSTVDNFMATSHDMDGIRENPLMLSFICVLYRGYNDIPRRRVQLYRKCVELLLRDWDLSRGITPRGWEVDVYESALVEIAYLIFSNPGYAGGMTERQLRDVAATNLLAEQVPTRFEAERIARELVSLCRGRGWMFTDVGLNEEGEEVFSFIHRSLLEYFAAYHFVREHETPEALAADLMPQVLALRGEVLAQVSVSLASPKWSSGASSVLAELLRNSAALQGKDHYTVLEFAVNTADSVPLNREALFALLSSVVDAIGLPSTRRLERVILGPRYRHAGSVLEVLETVLRVRLADDRAHVLELCHGTPWLWDFCLQHGLVKLESLNVVDERDHDSLLERLFSGQLAALTRRSPYCSALWLVESSFLATSSTVRLDAVRQLAQLREHIQHFPRRGSIAEARPALPDFPTGKQFDDLIAPVDLAIAKALGQRTAVLEGVTLIVLGLCEFIIAYKHPVEFPKDGFVSRFVRARHKGNNAYLPRIPMGFDDGLAHFIRQWVPGNCSVFAWEDPGQHVS